MKTQPQQLLESLIPLPEWVHEEWHREIANKWAIREAGEKLAAALRHCIKFSEMHPASRERADEVLAAWEKLLNEPKQPVV